MSALFVWELVYASGVALGLLYLAALQRSNGERAPAWGFLVPLAWPVLAIAFLVIAVLVALLEEP